MSTFAVWRPESVSAWHASAAGAGCRRRHQAQHAKRPGALSSGALGTTIEVVFWERAVQAPNA
eukprot:3621395-Alexandrium_andersonii.AAC.1